MGLLRLRLGTRRGCDQIVRLVDDGEAVVMSRWMICSSRRQRKGGQGMAVSRFCTLLCVLCPDVCGGRGGQASDGLRCTGGVIGETRYRI